MASHFEFVGVLDYSTRVLETVSECRCNNSRENIQYYLIGVIRFRIENTYKYILYVLFNPKYTFWLPKTDLSLEDH